MVASQKTRMNKTPVEFVLLMWVWAKASWDMLTHHVIGWGLVGIVEFSCDITEVMGEIINHSCPFGYTALVGSCYDKVLRNQKTLNKRCTRGSEVISNSLSCAKDAKMSFKVSLKCATLGWALWMGWSYASAFQSSVVFHVCILLKKKTQPPSKKICVW